MAKLVVVVVLLAAVCAFAQPEKSEDKYDDYRGDDKKLSVVPGIPNCGNEWFSVDKYYTSVTCNDYPEPNKGGPGRPGGPAVPLSGAASAPSAADLTAGRRLLGVVDPPTYWDEVTEILHKLAKEIEYKYKECNKGGYGSEVDTYGYKDECKYDGKMKHSFVAKRSAIHDGSDYLIDLDSDDGRRFLKAAKKAEIKVPKLGSNNGKFYVAKTEGAEVILDSSKNEKVKSWSKSFFLTSEGEDAHCKSVRLCTGEMDNKNEMPKWYISIYVTIWDEYKFLGSGYIYYKSYDCNMEHTCTSLSSLINTLC